MQLTTLCKRTYRSTEDKHLINVEHKRSNKFEPGYIQTAVCGQLFLLSGSAIIYIFGFPCPVLECWEKHSCLCLGRVRVLITVQRDNGPSWVGLLFSFLCMKIKGSVFHLEGNSSLGIHSFLLLCILQIIHTTTITVVTGLGSFIAALNEC